MSEINKFAVKRMFKCEDIEKVVIGSGCEKICYKIEADNCKDIAFLSIYGNEFYNQPIKTSLNLLKKKALCNYLNKIGIRTPKIYGAFFSKRKYHEIHELVNGQTIAPSSAIIKNDYQEIYGEFDKNDIFASYSVERKPEYMLFALEKIDENVKTFLDAPSSHYQELFRMLEKGMELFGCKFYNDLYDKNVMYSKEVGFSLIDIDYEYLIENFVKVVSGGKISIKKREAEYYDNEKYSYKEQVAEEAMHLFTGSSRMKFLWNSLNSKNKSEVEFAKAHVERYNKLILRIAMELQNYGINKEVIKNCVSKNYFDNEKVIFKYLDANAKRKIVR